MKNSLSPRILYFALAVEVTVALFFLILSGGIGTILTLLFLFAFVGGGIFILSRNGTFSSDKYSSSNYHWQKWENERQQTMSWDNDLQHGESSNFNFNVGLNINPGFERSETLSKEIPIESTVSSLQVDVNNGDLKVIGEAGLNQIMLSAVKRVWEKDEASIRRELDRLQVRTRQDNGRLIIEAGQFDNPNNPPLGVNISLGKPPRIDLELRVPTKLPANFSTNTGSLDLSELESEIAARTTAGGMNIRNINGGHNLTLATTSGRIVMQQITTNILRARATTGSLDLTAIGTDALELETLAGTVMVRGVNCGRLAANVSTGSIVLADINTDGDLKIKATAGRIQAENIKAASFEIETTTGSVHYRGTAPTAPSLVQTGVGSTDLIFAAGSNYNLDARSNLGSVQVFVPINNPFNSNRNWFQGQVGLGGPTVNVVSQVGSVRISQG